VQLLLNPLVGAVSAGCTAVLKPSPYTPHVSETLARMIAEIYDEEYVAVVEGDREVNARLLEERWDIIFFTGSPDTGRVVMASAARNLTPVVLELGGKSPVIVDRGADVELAARRIAWGKCLNAGQTCVAPDYLFVHAPLLEPFTAAFARAVRRLLGDDPRQSRHYARLVSARAFDRVAAYLSEGRILAGGRTDAAERYIEPTLLGDVPADASVMREEIFGPVLPLFAFDRIDEAIDFIEERPRPLALYYFGSGEGGRRGAAPHDLGRRLPQRHRHADRQRSAALRRSGRFGHGALSRPRQFRTLHAPPCRRLGLRPPRPSVPLHALPVVPLGEEDTVTGKIAPPRAKRRRAVFAAAPRRNPAGRPKGREKAAIGNRPRPDRQSGGQGLRTDAGIHRIDSADWPNLQGTKFRFHSSRYWIETLFSGTLPHSNTATAPERAGYSALSSTNMFSYTENVAYSR